MANFEDLPIEILIEIVKMAVPVDGTELEGKSGLPKLRLVSPPLNKVVSSILFAEVHLQFRNDKLASRESTAPDIRRCLEIVNALAAQSSCVFEHTRKLSLSAHELYWTTTYERNGILQARRLVLDKIFPAICALTNLRTIRYQPHSEYEPEELTTSVIQALGTLPHFEGFDDLHFISSPRPTFTFLPLSSLTTLHISWTRSEYIVSELSSLLARCPDLHAVCLRCMSKDTMFNKIFAHVVKTEHDLKLKILDLQGLQVTLEDIKLNIRHLKHLSFLGITSNCAEDADATFGQICNLLAENKIYLEGISTDVVTDPFLMSYLTSYSGLTRLLLEADITSTESLADAIDQIYIRVLPRHSESLVVLRLGSRKVPSWGEIPTVKQLEGLLFCQKLRSLKVCLNYSTDHLDRRDTTLIETWFDIGSQLTNLTRLEITPHFNRAPSASILMGWQGIWKEAVRTFQEGQGMNFLCYCGL